MDKSLPTVDSSGRFVTNLLHFGRILRMSGLPIGPGRVIDAVRAVQLVGVANRQDFYWTLHSVFVNHPRQREIFDQAFQIFWKNPRILERSISFLLPETKIPESEKDKKEIARRLAESLYANKEIDAHFSDLDPDGVELKASMTYSDQERLQEADFDAMSRAEMQQAKQAIAKMRVAFEQIQSRRYQRYQAGTKLDMRKTLKASLKGTADTITLVKCRKKLKSVPVIVLCDISGSMSEYSRMILHFSHVLSMSRSNVSCFVFGTRLTNITRHLRVRDVDDAMNLVSDSVVDWYGGTKIGDCIKDFNQQWLRRLPIHSAVVLLITDGLDRSERTDLESQVRRLHRSCRELIWLNPLLRYDKFQPRVSGIRKILANVDAFLPVHNLKSMNELANLLSTATNDNFNKIRQHQRYWRSQLDSTTGSAHKSQD